MFDLNEPAPLSTENFGEIYTTPNTWILDDTNVQIATKTENFNGNNGAVLMFSPQTGQLLMKVIDVTEFATVPQGLNVIAEWKTSEEVTTIVRGFPSNQKPKQIIVTRNAVKEYLKFHLQDSPDVVIRGCDLQLPLYATFATDKLGNLLTSLNRNPNHPSSGVPEKPLMVSVNMYDAWLFEGLTPYTAFFRLILICRALAVNCQKAKTLLKPAHSAGVVTPVDRIWPSLTQHQWSKVEVSFKGLIFSEFQKKTSNLHSSLKQSLNRDILLGLHTTASVTH